MKLWAMLKLARKAADICHCGPHVWRNYDIIK